MLLVNNLQSLPTIFVFIYRLTLLLFPFNSLCANSSMTKTNDNHNFGIYIPEDSSPPFQPNWILGKAIFSHVKYDPVTESIMTGG